MMRFDPSLIVTRLVVERGQQAVYDERFHAGVNVIRGENSSGKSTILNFIFYGLGGDLADWSEVALLCSRVLVEASLNGKVATLSREISRQHGQAMEVFGGDVETGRKAPRSEWVRYPYRRTQNLESFSQVLFRLLRLPEVATEISGNLTMNQVLRLLYADQLSPIENLFKFEHFDQPAIRDAVGRLLCGAYDSSIYENELGLRVLTREFDTVNAELRSLLTVLGRTEHNLTLEWVAAQQSELEQERERLHRMIEEAERRLFVISSTDDKLTLRAQEVAYAEVQQLQQEIGTFKQSHDALQLTVADSAAFIASLENKIVALNDSAAVAEHLGDVEFSVCPACYAPISAPGIAGACHLCKTPFDSERMRGRIVALINDASVQVKQSQQLQERRRRESVDVEQRLRAAEASWRRASERLASLRRLPSSELGDELRGLHRQAGYLERQIEDMTDKARIVGLIDQLSNRKDEINDAITRLQTQIERLRASQEQRLSRAYTEIADEVRELLHNDLRRQDSFENAQSIDFDFRDNRINVDGHTYFSASSRVILKSSFFIGFLAAATKDASFRHPRFCMIDTVEDKGMEPDRSRNFQNLILRVSSAVPVEHQIIYATSMISPDLDYEEYTVGKFSTGDDPSLAKES